MFDLLLYSGMLCADADALMLRIKENRSELPPRIVVELVETVKDLYLSANLTGTQTTEGTGNGSTESEKVNHPLQEKQMNTLTIIKKQIEKASALHDAQIAMTAYRGVKFECKQGAADEVHGTFCYRGHTYNK